MNPPPEVPPTRADVYEPPVSVSNSSNNDGSSSDHTQQPSPPLARASTSSTDNESEIPYQKDRSLRLRLGPDEKVSADCSRQRTSIQLTSDNEQPQQHQRYDMHTQNGPQNNAIPICSSQAQEPTHLSQAPTPIDQDSSTSPANPANNYSPQTQDTKKSRSWSFRMKLMDRREDKEFNDSGIHDSYLGMNNYDFMNISEIVSSSRGHPSDSPSSTLNNYPSRSLSMSKECNMSPESGSELAEESGESGEQGGLFVQGGGNRTWSYSSSRSNLSGNDAAFKVNEACSKDSLASFNEWTPQDSAYGAACPVCGSIPKKIRRAIEMIIMLLVLASFVYLIVTTSIRLTANRSSSGSDSGQIDVDDDYYIDDPYQ